MTCTLKYSDSIRKYLYMFIVCIYKPFQKMTPVINYKVINFTKLCLGFPDCSVGR